MPEARRAGHVLLSRGWNMSFPPTWEVTFAAPGFNPPAMTFTFARLAPGDAVTALWTELEAMPETRAFLLHVTRIRVQKVEI
jgi:hypothetical protein